MRWLRVLQGALGAALVVAGIVAAVPVRALEVTCIEASRYKYLYRIFGDDRARFAAFFGADVRRLPPPQACRAVLLTGTIDKPERGGGPTDFDRLLEAIDAGRGWLSTLYLATPGGNVGMGLRLANLARMFWLNTYAVEGVSFEYVPDFLSAGAPGTPVGDLPPDLRSGWQSYRDATGALTRIELAGRRERRCVSACTFIHTAGVYRSGPAYFHRARRGRSHSDSGGRVSEPASMSSMLEGLQRTEQRIVAHYRKMDSGEAAIRAYESTATQTTHRVDIPAFPRYIGDYLSKRCRMHPRRPQAERTPGADMQEGGAERSDSAKGAEQTAVADAPALSMEARQCLVEMNAKERWTQFTKLCYDGCDRATILHEAANRVRALLPHDRQDEPRRRGR